VIDSGLGSDYHFSEIDRNPPQGAGLVKQGDKKLTGELLSKIKDSLVEGEPETTVALTVQALQEGLEPLTIIKESLVPGMNVVGEKFACGEYFLPELVIAADGMQQAMDLLEPELLARNEKMEVPGTVVLGTVKGDIHAIGKSLVGTMLTANGFKVHDLGVDVPVENFLAKVQETGAELLGLSALLTTTMLEQKAVVEALERAGMRGKVKVLVGGAPVSHSWAQEIGADGYAEDAIGAVQLAQRLLGS
jgi:corrinoid protein of di/trimethylamine methyltransferase